MNRRSFLRLAIGATAIVASGLELLRSPPEESEIWSGDEFSLPMDSDVHFKMHMEMVMKNLEEITKQIWYERTRAEWLKLAGANG